MTDQRATDDEMSMDRESADDERTIDPELTTAADAGWLAELRSRAKSSGVSVGELMRSEHEHDEHGGEHDDHDGDHGDDGDDGATIAPEDDTMEIVRAAVAAARPTPTMEDAPAPAPAPEPAPVATPAPPPPEPVDLATARLRQQSDPSPRWEPPARLSTGRDAPIPTLAVTEARRSIMPLVAGLTALVVALIVVVVILVWPGGDDAPIDPTDTGVENEVEGDNGVPAREEPE